MYLNVPYSRHTTYEFLAILISRYVDSTIGATSDHEVYCVLVDFVMRGAILLVIGKLGDGIERFLSGEQEFNP
jgi:hypothetical protein